MERFLKDMPLETLAPVCTKEDLLEIQKQYPEVFIHEELMEYIVKIVQETRENADLAAGVSPRGTLALLRAVRAYAFVQGRDYVVPEDVKFLAGPVLAHRLVFPRGTEGREAGLRMIDRILERVPVPTENWSR